MITHIQASGPLKTNSILIVCPNTNQAAVIDPSPTSCPKLQTILESNRWILTQILLTHSHWDHIADIGSWKKLYPNLKVYVHNEDLGNVVSPGSDGIPLPFPISSNQANVLIKDGDRIKIGNLEALVIHTPGHSPGSVCYHFKTQNALLSGDTLFKGTIGSLSLSTGEPHRMWNSLEKLSQLPLETVVYPGHGPQTLIAKEVEMLRHAKELFDN
jgi:glyoxylase-like metal-dependent hydrolase (beta-lactamase superfamily II)